MSSSILGIDVECNVVVRNSTLVITQVVTGGTQVVVSGGILRVDVEGSVKVGNGTLVITLMSIGNAPVPISVDILRVDVEGSVKVGNGQAVFTFVVVGKAPFVVSVGILWMERNGTGVVGDGLVNITFLVSRLAVLKESVRRIQILLYVGTAGIKAVLPLTATAVILGGVSWADGAAGAGGQVVRGCLNSTSPVPRLSGVRRGDHPTEFNGMRIPPGYGRVDT